jgi:hypothetical protein
MKNRGIIFAGGCLAAAMVLCVSSIYAWFTTNQKLSSSMDAGIVCDGIDLVSLNVYKKSTDSTQFVSVASYSPQDMWGATDSGVFSGILNGEQFKVEVTVARKQGNDGPLKLNAYFDDVSIVYMYTSSDDSVEETIYRYGYEDEDGRFIKTSTSGKSITLCDMFLVDKSTSLQQDEAYVPTYDDYLSVSGRTYVTQNDLIWTSTDNVTFTFYVQFKNNYTKDGIRTEFFKGQSVNINTLFVFAEKYGD